MARDSETQHRDLHGWLQTKLGDHLVLAEPASGCIGLLNPLAAWVCEARQAGLTDAEIASSLANQFNIDALSARQDVDRVVALQAELLHKAQNFPPREEKPPPDSDVPIPFTAIHTLQLKLGLRKVQFEAQSTALFELLEPCIRHLCNDGLRPHYVLQLRGTPDYWQIVFNNEVVMDGSGGDDAVCSAISEMVQLGCDCDNPLLVVHGAGICHEDRGALLIGKGGCGKTTLAAALNAAGFDLINDDVIAVSSAGELSSAHMSLCLKQGSWPVLEPELPAINNLHTFNRRGQVVRFLPPAGNTPVLPVRTSAFIFPSRIESGQNNVTELGPWETLQGIVEAESFIPDLDQQSLDDLAAWIASAPGYRVEYVDIDSGVDLVGGLIRSL